MKIPVFALDPEGPLHCTLIAELAQWAVEKAGEAWPARGPEALAFVHDVANREGVFLDMAHNTDLGRYEALFDFLFLN